MSPTSGCPHCLLSTSYLSLLLSSILPWWVSSCLGDGSQPPRAHVLLVSSWYSWPCDWAGRTPWVGYPSPPTKWEGTQWELYGKSHWIKPLLGFGNFLTFPLRKYPLFPVLSFQAVFIKGRATNGILKHTHIYINKKVDKIFLIHNPISNSWSHSFLWLNRS